MFKFRLSNYLKNKRIRTEFKEDIEPQEILLDKLAQKKEDEIGLTEKKFEVPLQQRTLRTVWFLFLILILLLFSKSFQLQVIQGEKFSALAEKNKFTFYSIKAERGIIYDKDFNQLVFNQPAFDLVYKKSDLSEEKIGALRDVSEILNLNFEDLKKKIEDSQYPMILIAENLDHQLLILFETKINSGEFSDFQIENNTIREYKDSKTFAHLFGYTGRIRTSELKEDPGFYSISDSIGRDGIEKSYEKVLRKNPGKFRLERDAFGNLISKETIQWPEPGNSLVLWLDSELQEKAFQSLDKNIKRVGAKKGALVAMDPKTGGILSLISLPSFDNNLFQKGSDIKELKNLLNDSQQPLFNRAISGLYPVGSTIKPLIALAALEENIISPEKQIYDKGLIEVPHRYNPEIVYTFKDWEVHGWTDMRKAIAESCNVYFYTIGGGYEDQEGLGPTRIKKYLELFGWGETTGINLPGEEDGLLPSPSWKEKVKKENWWDGDTYHFSIGQGDILTTPLQVVSAFSAIANNGTLFKPQVVYEILDSKKNVIEEIQPEIIRENFIDLENIQVVREGMREAVIYGSSVIFNNLPVKAASKTGTSQTSKQGYYHHWVTVFAPYDDPEIVLTVLLEDVKEIQFAALPVAKEILEWYFANKSTEKKID